MRVLIIGCGYVGLPLGAELTRRGHLVFGLRRSATVEPELRAARIEPLYADITQPEDLAKLPRDFDWMVNCVSSSGGGPAEYRRIYLEGMRNIMRWLAGVPVTKFVSTSSTSVYGQNDGSIVTEESPTTPDSETAQVLLETEKLLLDAARREHFPAVVLRLAGIYGPGRGYWLKRFLDGPSVTEEDRDRILNMVHRDDVVGSIIAPLERGRAGGIYNVVDDEPARLSVLFDWLSRELKRKSPAGDETERRSSGNGGVAATRKRGATNKRVSNRKLREELGYWMKFPSFREGFAELSRR